MKKQIIVSAIALLSIHFLESGTGAFASTWTQKANFSGGGRHGASAFAIGDTVYIGTGNTTAINMDDFWGYNPATDTWKQLASLPGGYHVNGVGFAVGSKGYIMGGNNGSNINLFEYDPSTNTWTQKGAHPVGGATGAIAFVINGKAYVGIALGNNNNLWEYNPVTDTWIMMNPFIPPVAGEAQWTAAFAIGNKGYVGTGKIGGSIFNDFYEFDPATNVWTKKADLGVPITTGTQRKSAVGFALNGKGYIGAGYDGLQPFFSDFWEYDPALDTWTNNCVDTIPARYSAVAVTTSNAAYVGTGYPCFTCNYKLDDFWKFTPGSCGSPTVLAASTSLTCNGNCNAAATATVTGGSPSYTYAWSNGATTSTATGLCAGSYSVLITDAASATAASMVTITEPSALATPSLTPTPSNCGNNGAATVSVSGGTGAYTYLWNSSGQTTTTATGLSAGTYTATVTDANGCTNSNTVAVTSSGSVTVTAPSTTICSGQTATLTASGGTSYLWSTASTATTTAIVVSPAVTTTYTVTVSSGTCSDSKSTTVTVNPLPIITAFPGTTLCKGDIATLTASGASVPYSWNTGTVGNSILAATPSASYSVTSNGCTGSITMNFLNPPAASAANTTICSGKNAILAAHGGVNYFWINLNATDSIIPVSPTTNSTYSVIVSIGSCSDTAMATVVVNQNPVASILSNTSSTAGGSTTLIASVASGGATYYWTFNGATNDTITVNPPTTVIYCVIATDTSNGCSANACETVVGGCSNTGELFLPDAFSPNYDGENDTLRIYYGNFLCIKDFHIAIYDRWGEIVFQSHDPAFKWDGTQRGKWLDPAVFAYYLKVTFLDESTIDRKGNISLVK